MKKYIGLDIGGTKIHGALVDANGKILEERFVETEVQKGKKHVLNKIFLVIDELYSKDVLGIGIGSPGPLDIKKGKILNTPNLPLKNFFLRDAIYKKYKIKTILDNDANCFVLGEACFGIAKGKKSVVGLTMGTGIGGGIVLDGKIFHGKNNAGHIGHSYIDISADLGHCGHYGCVESLIGKYAIIDRAKEIGFDTPYDLYKAAVSKNKKAKELWVGVGFYLGVTCANIMNILDPEIIVIGGNVAGAYEFFEKEMNETAKKVAVVPATKIVKSKLMSKAAVLGAAKLVME